MTAMTDASVGVQKPEKMAPRMMTGEPRAGIAPTTVLNTLLPVSFSPSPMFRQAVLDRPL